MTTATQARAATAPNDEELEISEAAIRSYGRLQRAVRNAIALYATSDGGLICEDRTIRGRPTLWRILCDGTVLGDRPYSFSARAFVAAELPLST
jgi:hypothetical protein